MTTHLDQTQISGEALDWFLSFQDSTYPRPSQQDFAEWLTRSPAHIQEYLNISCTWDLLEIPDEGNFETEALTEAARERHESDNILRLPDRYNSRKGTSRSRPLRLFSRESWVAWAACALLAAGTWLTYKNFHSSAEFATVVGEQHGVTLQDGSVVVLNTDSKVDVRWLANERHIDLVRGEARFQVARNPTRPFIVATSKAEVRAVGTVFNVRADQQSTQVAVLEGQVEVMPLTTARTKVESDRWTSGQSVYPSIRLAAGERAAVTNNGIEANAGPSIESVAAWTQRRLVFHDETLRTIVNEFNRYHTRPLVLDDPQLAALKISGAFDLNDPESLVAYLQTFETVRVERPFDGSEHLSRDPVPDPP
jgi:transmembrane sensor